MRLYKYLNEEDIVQKALKIDEPEVGEEYPKDEVKEKLSLLQSAIDVQSKIVDKDEDDKALQAILDDLMDKKDKWINWKKEVKSKGPNPDATEPTLQEEE